MIEVAFPAGHWLKVLEHRAKQHDFMRWEAAYLQRLLTSLRPGDVVYDIGSEEGEFSALVAQVVGPGNVHLIEPSPTVWPNARRCWEANHAEPPGGCWIGFFADDANRRGRPPNRQGWPMVSRAGVAEYSAFAFVDERPDIPSTTAGIYAMYHAAPTVLMLDVEGAEALVLRGAERVLPHCRLVYVSLHPPSFLAKYKCQQSDVFALCAAAGLSHAELVSVDHEEHWEFSRCE